MRDLNEVVHLFNKNLLSTYYMPDSVLRIWDRMANKKERSPCPGRAHNPERKINNTNSSKM